MNTASNTTISFPTGNQTAFDFDHPKADATAIRIALTSLTVDANAIIKILGRKTRTQRLKIAEEYEVLFKSVRQK